MDKWKPTREQQLGAITRTFDFFNEELIELKDELGCPDDFIYEFLKIIINHWSPDSCHSKVRTYRSENPDLYNDKFK